MSDRRINTEIGYHDALDTYHGALEDGAAKLERMGFPKAGRPTDIHGELADRPVLPPNLSSMGMAELQDLLGYFTAWHTYAIERPPKRVRSSPGPRCGERRAGSAHSQGETL